MNGYKTVQYCPKCRKNTDCWRDGDREDLRRTKSTIIATLTCGLSLLFEDINEPYQYCYTCQECGHEFTTENPY